MRLFLSLLMLLTSYAVQAQLSLVPGSEQTDPSHLTIFGDKLVYKGLNTLPVGTRYELWSYVAGGDSARMTSVTGNFDGSFGAGGPGPAVAGKLLYIPADFRSSWFYHTKLYEWDGHNEPTLSIGDHLDFTYNIKALSAHGGKLYFAADSMGVFGQLWGYDPAIPKRERLSNVKPTSNQGFWIQHIIPFKDKVCFVAMPETKFRLMEHDTVTGINTAIPVTDTTLNEYDMFLEVDGKLYFTATTGINYPLQQLCVYDGKNPVKVLTSFKDTEIQNNSGLCYYKGSIYFILGRMNSQSRLWSYNITTGEAAEVETAKYIATPTFSKVFTEYAGKLYFSGMTSMGRVQLYSFDGAAVEIVDSSIHSPKELLVFNNDLYISACRDTNTVGALYVYNVPAAPHAVPVSDAMVYPNPAGSTATFSFVLQKDEPLSFVITDATGKTVLRNAIANFRKGQNNINFSVGNFSRGVYHCRLLNEQNKALWVKKLVKE